MQKTLLIILIVIFFGCKQKSSQEVSNSDEPKATEVKDWKQHFAEMEINALKKPYRGIFTEDETYENLFPIQVTGVTTKPIVDATRTFLSSLNTDQLMRIRFDINDEEWRKWCNVDNGIYDRQGISLKEMTANEKNEAFSLMQVSLSAKGLQLSKDIMKTDQTLKELNNGSSDYDEELYFFTVMGAPSETEPWGWQLDGHHLVINYFVLGDQVVMSPVFMGAEPIITTTGKYKGNTLFQDEQNLGLAFMRSLSADEQIKATISKSKINNNNVAEANKDNLNLNYEGLNVSGLSTSGKEGILDLVYQYISNMREGHQQIKMEEVKSHLENTWFSWVGDTSEDAVFYYRIHSPVLLIEFDHQRVIGVPNTDDGKPSRNHIHTVVRTPNGNDYGKDLLRQHLEKHHH
ncbi:MAG TPA: hypothetical protein DIT95_10365 [Arenibacter sp.]|nr:hypothetical protein [Arenibacter sp.]|tara:strand:- start:552 stop:1763 length:1212 start_codon:yes stop_codon:yes gene_type:complete